MTRHRIDVFALCAGLFFVLLAVGFVLDGLDTWDMDVGRVGPLVLITLGLAGVLSTLMRARATAGTEADAAAGSTSPDDAGVDGGDHDTADHDRTAPGPPGC
jgi:hypothetical protein